jgi:osmotically-inducible protein OsmY
MSIYTDQREQQTVEDITEAAEVRLQHSPYRAIRRVSCRFDDGTLTLLGCVPTFHHKQLAQTAVAGLGGVDQVDNRIEVS